MSFSFRNTVYGNTYRAMPFGPKPGAFTVRTLMRLPLAVLCAPPSVGLLIDVLQHTVLAHERHSGAAQTAALIAVAVFDHPLRHDPPQQVKQVVGVTTHQGAREQQHLAHLRHQHRHRPALRRTFVLVLVAFVHHEEVEITTRQISLDELRGLIPALAE